MIQGVKLLFDENLNPKLVDLLATEYPQSSHPLFLDLTGSSDTRIWEEACASGFIIVSKDNDFRQRAFLQGPPPKIIWLSVGNAGTTDIENVLRSRVQVVRDFAKNNEQALLVLTFK